MERLALFVVDRYGEVRVLHSFLYVSVGPYAIECLLQAFGVELSSEGLHLISEIPVASLTVRRAGSAVRR